ncbi:hypothetical protein GCM10010470_23600 [Saccharopolyspora taberi]|uniref:Uncharacterized protein n=1 Tax=Saccharopolyspora taberi TaxID=60895 RepID=A0ABN3VBY2_9PSEU
MAKACIEFLNQAHEQNPVAVKSAGSQFTGEARTSLKLSNIRPYARCRNPRTPHRLGRTDQGVGLRWSCGDPRCAAGLALALSGEVVAESCVAELVGRARSAQHAAVIGVYEESF